MTHTDYTLGTCFQPYVGPWVQSIPVLWDVYTLAQVTALLTPVSKVTKAIATYDQGTFVWQDKPLIQNSNQYNIQAAQAVGLKVSAGCALQGISGDGFNIEWSKCEVDFALAQAVSCGNVLDIVIGDESIFGPNSTNQLVKLITYAKAKRDALGLSMPITTRQRWDVMAGVNNTTAGYAATRRALLNLVAACDNYIYVDMYPYFDSGIANAIGSSQATQAQFNQAIQASMTATWTALQTAWQAQSLSLGIRLGETGWPTKGSQPVQAAKWLASTHFAEWYALVIHEWMQINKVFGFLFEAYDEPWKGPSDGLNSESHFGIWEALGTSSAPGQYTLTGEHMKYQVKHHG
jgi:exo-beta-1,3-glucanase (GH17 family)